jgi:hypothetical protein
MEGIARASIANDHQLQLVHPNDSIAKSAKIFAVLVE